MTTQADMDKLAARLAGLVGSELSIADQVRIDVLLYDVGETIRKLLIENKLCDMWAPEVTLESPDAPLMVSKRRAIEVAGRVYDALLDVRHALCWNSSKCPTTAAATTCRAPR